MSHVYKPATVVVLDSFRGFVRRADLSSHWIMECYQKRFCTAEHFDHAFTPENEHAGTWKSLEKEKEHHLNQTSILAWRCWVPYTPWRLTWNIIMEVWKIIFLSKWVICMFHVNLPGCNFPGYVFFFPQDGFGLLLGGLSPFLQSSWDPGGPRPGSTGPNTTTLVNRWRFGDMTWHSWHWTHVSNP